MQCPQGPSASVWQRLRYVWFTPGPWPQIKRDQPRAGPSDASMGLLHSRACTHKAACTCWRKQHPLYLQKQTSRRMLGGQRYEQERLVVAFVSIFPLRFVARSILRVIHSTASARALAGDCASAFPPCQLKSRFPLPSSGSNDCARTGVAMILSNVAVVRTIFMWCSSVDVRSPPPSRSHSPIKLFFDPNDGLRLTPTPNFRSALGLVTIISVNWS